MKKYVDGYVIVMPKKNLAIYKKMAQGGCKLWMKHGALQYFECIGDDMTPEMGGMKMLTFPKMAKAKPDEIMVFSFIIFKSKAHRDKVNAKVMKSMEKEMKKSEDKPIPFDMKKVAYGGFKTIVYK